MDINGVTDSNINVEYNIIDNLIYVWTIKNSNLSVKFHRAQLLASQFKEMLFKFTRAFEFTNVLFSVDSGVFRVYSRSF